MKTAKAWRPAWLNQSRRSVIVAVGALAVCLAAGGWWWLRDRTHDRVYRMGYQYSPPAQLLDAQGRPTGPIVEALNEAARRSGIRLEWVPVPEGPDAAFRGKKADLWPLVGRSAERELLMHISEPYIKLTYWVVTREGIPIPKRWTGVRVARGSGSVVARWGNAFLPGAQFVVVGNQLQAMEAACRGEVEGALVAEGLGDGILMSKPAACQTQRVVLTALPNSEVWFGVGAEKGNRGAMQVAGALRDKVGEMTLDGRFASLTLNWGIATSGQASTVYQYIESHRKENQLRIALGVVLVVLALLIWQERRLRRARKAADSASRAKSVFLANMSHEIRTPMNGVLGMAELMLQTPLSTEQRDYAETIVQSGRALLELINDILDLAKVEAGKMLLREEPLDPVEIQRDVVRLFRARIVEKGLKLVVEQPPDPGIRVMGDPLRLRQIVANLVSNAVKFTERGSIQFRLAMSDGGQGQVTVRYEVEDTGIGISQEDLQQLFQPFTQASEGGAKLGGSGLGLVICRKLAALMGGEIAVDSERGRGSKFVLSLQMARAAAPAQEAAPERTSRRPAAGARVLVVEDYDINRRLIQRMLESLGCKVSLAEDGQQALELAARETFDLVLLDMELPEMDGTETTRRMRALWSADRQAPVVALTSDATESHRRACLEAGVSDFVTKPMDLSTLAAAVERWVRAVSPAEK